MANIGEETTRKLIEIGDIKPGMKILDLGCGAGNVTFMLSNHIGSEGIVVGIDSDENAIESAKMKSKKIGHSNLYFQEVDLTKDFKIDYSDFDAIIVRRVLMYLPDSHKTIKSSIKYLKPNGLFFVQENNISETPIGLDSLPLHKKINELIRKTLEQEHINSNMGFELHAILTNAGLTVDKIWAEAVLSTPNQPTHWAFLAKVMKDRMLAHNVINNISDLELETLDEKLTSERLTSKITFITDLVFCAIARKI